MLVHTPMVITPTAARLVESSGQDFRDLSEKDAALYVQLASGRSPKALAFACIDSVISYMFRARPGEIAVHRNAGNCILPEERANGQVYGAAASIDLFAAKPNVELIVVKGHQDCAFVSAALTGKYAPGQERLKAWVDALGPQSNGLMLTNLGEIPKDYNSEAWHKFLWEAVKQHTIQQYLHLLTYSAIRRRVAEGSLTVLAAVLQLTPIAQLLWLDPITGQFLPATASLQVR